jgi:hypothetical protein
LSFCDGFAADYVAAAVVTGGVSVVLWLFNGRSEKQIPRCTSNHNIHYLL